MFSESKKKIRFDRACAWMLVGLFLAFGPALVQAGTASAAAAGPAPEAAPAPPTAPANGQAPQAVFPETSYEFSPVMEGIEIKHDFMIENHGAVPLVIKNVRPD